MTEPGPLLGFTVAITAARRSDELATLLTRRGASVVAAPAISMVPLADDARLRTATDRVIADPPDILIATTGIGFRGWIEAADGWGLAEDLLAALARTEVLARGPKVTGAVRAAGLRESWSPASESSEELLTHLRGRDLRGRDSRGPRIAVQLHGAPEAWDPNPGFLAGLAETGAEVLTVPVYRWEQPADTTGLDRVVEDIALTRIDAVTFTSASAAASVLHRARELRLFDGVRAALAGPVPSFCVGPVTAAPLTAIGVEARTPDRMRLGALARTVETELPRLRPDLPVAGHRLGVRAATAVVDGEIRDLTPTSMLLLRLLARDPGTVVPRDALLAALGGEDPHAVEAAVARLRTGLGHKALIATVVKRGYRIAV